MYTVRCEKSFAELGTLNTYDVCVYIYIHVYIYIYIYIYTHVWNYGGSQGVGVVSNSWLDRGLLSILHVQSPRLTDVQTPFLRTPLVTR